MFKKLLITSAFIFFLSSNLLLAVPTRFDISAYVSLGGFKGFQNTAALPPGTLLTDTSDIERDMGLNIYQIGGGVSWDLIFINNNNTRHYGMGISLYVNISAYNQGFNSDLLMDVNQVSFDPNDTVNNTNRPQIQMLNSINIQIAPLYRFYPTRDISIGVGPAINIMALSGGYIDDPYYTGIPLTSTDTNPTVAGTSNYYIQPMFGGTFYISAIVDVQITKFFGNVGITGGLALQAIFVPVAIGLETSFGVRYRFNP